MFRRYNRKHSRFDQPDPNDGGYDFTDPQSFNRYAYTQNDPVNFAEFHGQSDRRRYAYTKNDPVNFRDPSGLDIDIIVINVHGQPWIWGGNSGSGGEFLGANPHADDPRKPWRREDPEPQNTDQPAPDVAGIRANLAKALEDQDCANFIKDLLSRVASDSNPLVKGGDLLKVLDTVLGIGGLVRKDNAGGAQAYGSVGEKNAAILFGNVVGPIARTGGDALKNYLLWSDSDSVIHELIHLAGLYSYSDEQLARAVDQMPDTPELGDVHFPTNGTDAEKRSFAFKMSRYWNGVLREHCKRTKSPN